ncbi:AAA family ATPase [Pseudomonas aeruginosa]|uniref:ATP-binding protein n=1 Tax=Pseudomonas aeruginosa TaxID=287 RepID=UPI0021E14BDD|nr:ATP-binding protein [Pseudomonas aeruginosa]MCV0332694.1 AAA family ATPase [Pseudomonas aeruginosa]
MTVFVAGVHGVGKTYLCQQFVCAFPVLHESASRLIRRERALADWSLDKRVVNIDENQAALCRAVQRITSEGRLLLLDGHFVLIDEKAEFVNLETSIFKKLHLHGVVLLEASPETIVERLVGRDNSKITVDLVSFMEAERKNAKSICDNLGTSLKVLFEPDFDEFFQVVSGFFKREG